MSLWELHPTSILAEAERTTSFRVDAIAKLLGSLKSGMTTLVMLSGNTRSLLVYSSAPERLLLLGGGGVGRGI